MDTHHLPHLQDPMTMERINVRARTFSPDLTCAFHKFDANRFEWLARELEDAGRPEHARLARAWMQEHRDTADRIAAQDEANPFADAEFAPLGPSKVRT
jgi:hypothetical protein